MNHYAHDALIPSGWEVVKIGKYSLPSPIVIYELINAPKLDPSLAKRILEQYELTPLARKKINQFFLNYNPDTFWEDILKVMRGNLNNQNWKLSYILFSLQKYRFQQTSIDLNSMEYLRLWNNSTIAKIKAKLEERIQSPTLADRMLKDFYERKRVEWEECLYNDLAIDYLIMMLPSPLGIINNINNDYAINSLGRDKLKREIEKKKCEKELKILKLQAGDDRNQMRRMELAGKIEELQAKITKLESDLRFDRQENLNTYFSRGVEVSKKLCAIFSEAHLLLVNQSRSTILLGTELPEYSNALAEDQRRNINLKNLERSNGVENFRLCQCQFCYRYRFDRQSGNGKYSWHCDPRDKCEKAYKAWCKHLNDSCKIQLSKVFDVG
jgi:hypothetical protein